MMFKIFTRHQIRIRLTGLQHVKAMKDEDDMDFTALLKRILPKLKTSITEQLQKKAP